MKQWPEGNKPVKFYELADPLVDVAKMGYDLIRKNQTMDLPYDGFQIGEKELVAGMDPDMRLTVKFLEDRELIDEIITIAIQLGIEQGRRMTLSGKEIEVTRKVLKVTKSFLDELDEKLGNIH